LESEIKEDFSQLDKIDIKATGQRIKFIVQNAGYSQSQLAKLLRRDSKTISNYYRGKSLPDKIDFIILSRILGKSYDELLVFKGDMEGYQRIDHYLLDYNGHDEETISEAINRSKTESKLFNPTTQGHANIRNFEEAGYCLEFFHSLIQQDIRKRMMDELLSGRGVDSDYMHHIFESYIWRKLSNEQKAESKAQFAILRGEKKGERY
jgi:transcriptional regulator with XRE-family HTH domain